MAIHSSILTWRIPMDRGAWQATVNRIVEEPGTCSLGGFEFQGKRNDPSLTLRSGPRRPGRICLFFSPQRGFPPLKQV